MKFLTLMIAISCLMLVACESDQDARQPTLAAGALSDDIVCPDGVRCELCCTQGCTMTCEETEDGQCLVTCFIDGAECCSKVIEPGACTIPAGGVAQGCAPCPEH